MIDLEERHSKTVSGLLALHVPECEVWAFGSRVSGKAKKYSDLDLALFFPGPPGLGKLENLKLAFSESDLPFRVDVLDWSTVSPEFRKVIEARHEVINI